MAFIFKITIKGSSNPPIWRKIKVDENTSFEHFHYINQATFGWDNSHPFVFSPKGYGSYPKINSDYYGGFLPDGVEISDAETFPQGEIYDAGEIKLKDYFKKPKQKIVYIYDFGDDWTHIIELVKITDEKLEHPVCVSGKGSNLMDDSGGIWGFYNMVEAVNDPKHPNHENYMEWFGMEEGEKWDLNEFSIEDLNEVFKEL